MKKIIKNGSVFIWKGECKHCGCEFEYNLIDVEYPCYVRISPSHQLVSVSPRDDEKVVKCPFCGSQITHNGGGKISSVLYNSIVNRYGRQRDFELVFESFIHNNIKKKCRTDSNQNFFDDYDNFYSQQYTIENGNMPTEW